MSRYIPSVTKQLRDVRITTHEGIISYTFRTIYKELSLTNSLLDLTDKKIDYRKKQLVERRIRKVNLHYRKRLKYFDFYF